MTTARLGFLALAAASAAVFIASGWSLATRIEQWNETEGRPLFYFSAIETTDFAFAGKPVTVTEDLNDAGEGHIVVQFGDDTLRIPVTVANEYPLPLLARHANWLRFHAFFEGTRGESFKESQAARERGDIPTRLVAVVRTPFGVESGEGLFDLETEEDWGWGEVRRDRWAFTFHEFLPEGGWSSETLRFPESGRSFYRRQIEAEKKGLPAPTRREDELKEATWQFDAAHSLMNRPPSITNEQQALRRAGWTLPVASASIVVMLVSLGFAFAPRRPEDDTEPAT